MGCVEIEQLLATVHQNRIFNGDETSCCSSPRAVHPPDLAAIRASGKRDLPDVVARDQTVRVERTSIGERREHRRAHSPSGWMIQETVA
jgi:hypothetical protein